MPQSITPESALSRPGFIAEQFADAAQQDEADTLGIWGFLTTEVLLFGVMFTAYAVMRMLYPEAFVIGSGHLGFWEGTINTAVLLCSSLFVALAVNAAESGRRAAIAGFLGCAVLLGLIFLGIKAYEYYSHYVEGFAPGVRFTYDGPMHGQVQLFFFFYYMMTGIHALHMVVGVIVLSTVAVLALRGWFDEGRYKTVEVAGLYWHFVDIVWVFLYPLFYLAGVRGG